MRLVHIQLRDFRAFPGEFEIPLATGSNLLLYGENGSGKSSLATALREFVALDRPLPRPIVPFAHAFPDPGQRNPRVQLTFEENGAHEDIAWEAGRLHPLELDDNQTPPSTTQNQRERLVAVSRQSGFYDYRAVLRTSYRSGDEELSRQLFHLFVDNLLGRFLLVPGGSELIRERWKKILSAAPATRHKWKMRSSNAVAEPLNSALSAFLDGVRVEANRLLNTYFPSHRLNILAAVTPGCRFEKATKKLTGDSVLLEIEYNGRTNREV